MKRSTTITILLGVAVAAAATGLIIYGVRRHRSNRISLKVADEGYETAHDILFPNRSKKRRLLYGS
jgi:hypothetical protein